MRTCVDWTDSDDQLRGGNITHVLLTSDGLSTEIRRYSDREAAAQAIS